MSKWINNHANGIICYWALLIGMLFQIGTIRQGVPIWMSIPMGLILLISIFITILRKDIPKGAYIIPCALLCIYLCTQVFISYKLKDGPIFWIYSFRAIVGIVMMMLSLKVIESKYDFMLWGIIKKYVLLAFIVTTFFEIFCFMSVSGKSGQMYNFYQIANFLISEWCFYYFNTYLIVPEEYSFNINVFLNYLKLLFAADMIALIFILIMIYGLNAPIGFPVVCCFFFIASREIAVLAYVIERKMKRNPYFISDYYTGRLFYLEEDRIIADQLRKEYSEIQNRVNKVKIEIDNSKGESKAILEDYLKELIMEKEDLQNTYFTEEDIEKMREKQEQEFKNN